MHFYNSIFFFFNDTATTEIYTLSLHDALPISDCGRRSMRWPGGGRWSGRSRRDRKSTRLNSSHSQISYAVFCLKKKKDYTADTELQDEFRSRSIPVIGASSHLSPLNALPATLF